MSDTSPKRKKSKGSPLAYFRLHPINHAYLADILRDGSYGGTKSEILRRFVEEGIRKARNEVGIPNRNIDDYGGPSLIRDD